MYQQVSATISTLNTPSRGKAPTTRLLVLADLSPYSTLTCLELGSRKLNSSSMDALAAYGSDDSSSCSSEAPPSGPVKATADSPTSRSQSKVLEEAQLQETASNRKRRWDHGSSSGASSSNENSTNNHQTPPSIPSSHLPPPSLRQKETQKAPSMIEWDTDYLSTHHQSAKAGGKDATAAAESRIFLAERLKRTHADKSNVQNITEGGRAAQLQEQHDFHNPRFLDNAAQQCGILSRMQASTTTPLLGNRHVVRETFDDFEFRIAELEEQSRIQASRNENDA